MTQWRMGAKYSLVIGAHTYHYYECPKPNQPNVQMYFVQRNFKRNPNIFYSKKDVLEHYPNLKG